MINVYQINFTTEQVNEINSAATAPDYFTAYRDATLSGDVYPAWNMGLYDHVADVSVDDLETAFMVMNRWDDVDEKLVKRYKPLHSMSVGDVVINNDLAPDRYTEYAVAPVGFSPIKLNWGK